MDNKLVLIGVLIIIGAAFVIIGALNLRKRAKLLERGKNTTAKVTNVTVTTKTVKKKDRDERKTVYNCTLEYMAENKLTTVKYSTEQPHVAGETMEVVYLPEAPEQYMLANTLSSTFLSKIVPMFFIGLGIVLLIVGVVMAFR